MTYNGLNGKKFLVNWIVMVTYDIKVQVVRYFLKLDQIHRSSSLQSFSMINITFSHQHNCLVKTWICMVWNTFLEGLQMLSHRNKTLTFISQLKQLFKLLNLRSLKYDPYECLYKIKDGKKRYMKELQT